MMTFRLTTTRISFGLALGAAAISLASAGCAKSAGQEARANVQTFERDQKPQRLVELGKAFAQMGDLTRAEQYFAAALEAGADSQVVVPMLLRVCIGDGRYRAAIEYGEMHLRSHPKDSRTRFVVASVYAGIGEADKAREHLEKVVVDLPEQAEAHFALAVLIRESFKDPVEADRQFREYLRISPTGKHAEEAQASLLRSVQ